ADVAPAMARGVDVLKKGGVCVIDLHVDPPSERQASHALGHRATGECIQIMFPGRRAAPLARSRASSTRYGGATLIRDRNEHRVCNDPGSAAHHFAPLRAALRPGNAA